MVQVLDFSVKHHPIGGMALHDEFGLVDIVDTDNQSMRQVTFYCDDTTGDQISQVLCDAWVHTRDLTEVNPAKDIAALVAKGEL